MSMQSDRFLHHLTPRGWLAGTETVDGITHCENTPSDCFLSVEEHRYRRSYADDEEVSIKDKFRSDDEGSLSKLISMFGKTPEIAEPFKVPRRKKR